MFCSLAKLFGKNEFKHLFMLFWSGLKDASYSFNVFFVGPFEVMIEQLNKDQFFFVDLI